MGVTAPPNQKSKLVQAAADAKVPWIFPNDWSPDTADESLIGDMMLAGQKKKPRDLIDQLGVSSWISVSTGFWYEWSLGLPLGYGFNIRNRAVTLYDDGEAKITTSTWPQVGRAMAALLSLKVYPEGGEDKSPSLDMFRNSWVYVSSFTISQKDMLESLLRVTQTSLDDWKIAKEGTQNRYKAGIEQLKSGDRFGFVKAMYVRAFYPDGSGNVEKTKGLHNKLLGLPKEDIDESTKVAIQRAAELVKWEQAVNKYQAGELGHE